MYPYQYPPEMPYHPYPTRPLRERLGRGLAVALSLTGAAAAAAAIISHKLQAETLALITGLLCAGIPLVGVIIIIVFINAKKDARRQAQQPPQQMMIPPIIMQMPAQPQQPYPPTIDYPWALPRPSQATRTWDVVGEEEQ